MMQEMQPQIATLGNKAATCKMQQMQPQIATLGNKAATMYDATNATTNSYTRE